MTSSELDRYYCEQCKKLYSDICTDYWEWGHWIEKEWQRITDLVDVANNIPKKIHMMKTRTNKKPYRHLFQSQCPHCCSIHTLNVDDVMSGKLILKSRTIMKSKDNQMLKCLGEWLKFYGDEKGYFIVKNKKTNNYTLYNDTSRIKRQIESLLGDKSKPLNKIKNNLQVRTKE